ncbi:probable ribonuclease ZC3H12C [Colletes gigas]|uniref:probable ribonuclease ZC3H12C n=1 Tax=Colletes gigas TaxID=935657 RepID=UPI001C9B7B25|nr:probable ribonuclease ZC3H12C [Colletes gigas]
MSALHNSVIICDVFPKSKRKKTPLGNKNTQKIAKKKTFYESPLKHIHLSSKRWEQLQKQKQLLNNTKQTVTNKKNVFSSVDTGFNDSVIVLSDNESESNNYDEQSNGKSNANTRKRPLEQSYEEKQTGINSLCNSNKSTKQKGDRNEILFRGKRQKMNSDNDSSCLLISDTEDSEITTVSVDDENIAPPVCTNQSSDDIVVVWSSAQQSSTETQSEGNKIPNPEKDNRLFMIDCSPNKKNLSYLESNTATTSKKCKKNSKEKDQNEDLELLFNKPGLVLPKARDISRTIVMEKTKSILNTLTNINPYTPELPSTSTVDNATSIPQTIPPPPNGLREIIIDGNNVAMAHTIGKGFSEEGLRIVIDYFQQRGHSVKVFVPQYRRSVTKPFLEKWYAEGIVVFTPSRFIADKWITSYDDRYILQYATMCQGIVISLDQYRDLYRENPAWRNTIVNRLLAPTFVGNYVMFPEDPLGRSGPTLDEFLRHST